MTDLSVHSPGRAAGRAIVRLDLAGTAVAVATGIAGAVSAAAAKRVLTPVAFTLGALGIVAFLWSYAIAVERSRTAEIAVSQLYVVSGAVAPPPVRRLLRTALWVQITLAVTVMVVGFTRTEPEEFNWAATAIVVPLFGFGMNGMWVARHGTFGPRILTSRSPRRPKQNPAEMPESGAEMEQNSPHG